MPQDMSRNSAQSLRGAGSSEAKQPPLADLEPMRRRQRSIPAISNVGACEADLSSIGEARALEATGRSGTARYRAKQRSACGGPASRRTGAPAAWDSSGGTA